MTGIKGKYAILTGASRGIGRLVARELVREGINIAIAARDFAALSELAGELGGRGPDVLPLEVDVATRDGREKLVGEAMRRFGRIDILINNAALGVWAKFHEQDEAQIEAMVDTNLKAPMLLTRKVLDHMVKQGSGQIVNIGSLSGKKGNPYLGVYSGTKAGIMEWSSALRGELKDLGIGVSVICPTYVSGKGVFAKFGIDAPPAVGTVPAERVAKAVVDAIARNPEEVILSPLPVRPLLAINALFPALGSRILSSLGVVKMADRLTEMEKDLANK